MSIRVELIEGRGQRFSPSPGRVFAASTDHSFGELAVAIDLGFARWDMAHVHEFRLQDGTRIGMVDENDEFDDAVVDENDAKLSRLKPGEHFIYIFDLGDEWGHLCTVGESRSIDPRRFTGIVPEKPQPFFGWGVIPDQYGRDSADQDFD